MVKTVKKSAVKAKTPAIKTVKKVAEKPVKKTVSGLDASVVTTEGKSAGTMSLPKELFGEKINKQLMAQAVRVYLANQRQGGANTKTRGEVEGSTRKIYKQKGTGRARHGSIRAHIFVGGGVAFGPVTHDFSLTMPTKMKRKALASALTQQYHDGNIVFVDGMESLPSKTKDMAKALSTVAGTQSILLVLSQKSGDVARSARNIHGITLMPSQNLTTYDVLSNQKIVFMKDAVATISKAAVSK